MINKINIIKNLLISVQFYLNIKNQLTHTFSIFINKLNLNKKILLNYIKNKNYHNIYNFRNKLNFNKSKSSIKPSKKTGKARLSSSSSIIKKGLICLGLRNVKIKKYKNNSVLNHLIACNKNFININNLEVVKFTNNILKNNINISDKVLEKYNNTVFTDLSVGDFSNIFYKLNNIYIVY